MCLKFLLEGNRENQAIIRELEARGVANSADLEREFGVRADVRDGRVRVEQQQPPAPRATPQSQQTQTQRTYHQDQNYYTQHKPINGNTSISSNQTSTPAYRPLNPILPRPTNTASANRRASEGANANANTTASSSQSSTVEKLALMTERFNRLDINHFPGGLPIRSAPHQQRRQVGLPTSQSIRDAHIEEVGDEDEEGDVFEEGEEKEDGDGDEERQGRVLDVGDML